MNILLFFFAIPIAVIIISIILVKILKRPSYVIGIIFSVLIIGLFNIDSLEIYITAVIVYTIISIAVSYITYYISEENSNLQNNNLQNGNVQNNNVNVSNTNNLNIVSNNDNSDNNISSNNSQIVNETINSCFLDSR